MCSMSNPCHSSVPRKLDILLYKSGYGSEIPIIDQLVQSSLETCGYDDISLQGSSSVSLLHVEGNVRSQF